MAVAQCPQRLLLIRGLSEMPVSEIYDLFGKYGSISYFHEPDRTRGFAFLLYERRKSAAEAVSKLNGIVMKDSRWCVDFSTCCHNPKFSLRIEEIENTTELADLLHQMGKVGSIKKVHIEEEETDDSKSYILVHFSEEETAKSELQRWNDFKMGSKKLKAVLNKVESAERTVSKLRVKGIRRGTTAGQIRQVFGKFGEVLRAWFPPGSHQAYVEFSDLDSAEDALEEMDGRFFNDSRLIVEYWNQERKLQQAKPQRRLHVMGLPHGTGLRSLVNVFQKIGKVRRAYVPEMSSGYAWIEYDELKDAEEAMKQMNDTEFEAKRILLEYSTDGDRNYSQRRGASASYAGNRMRSGFGAKGGNIFMCYPPCEDSADSDSDIDEADVETELLQLYVEEFLRINGMC